MHHTKTAIPGTTLELMNKGRALHRPAMAEFRARRLSRVVPFLGYTIGIREGDDYVTQGAAAGRMSQEER